MKSYTELVESLLVLEFGKTPERAKELVENNPSIIPQTFFADDDLVGAVPKMLHGTALLLDDIDKGERAPILNPEQWFQDMARSARARTKAMRQLMEAAQSDEELRAFEREAASGYEFARKYEEALQKIRNDYEAGSLTWETDLEALMKEDKRLWTAAAVWIAFQEEP